MEPFAANVVPIRIQDELRSSYLDYSMSVIIGRALPDVRDGLKPVHRRILYAMHREGLLSSKRYAKCAGVVGEVLKKYHPHGDSAVYDALVRMAQPWNLRYPLVDGQGNFGSVDGDPAAAYRYTEARMSRIAEELLVDIDKDTVSYSPNFDDTVLEPDVLPARIPNLLVNGADGIAVGMATKIPPHNIAEIIDAAVALIEDSDLELATLIQYVPGPDFPTGATIYGRKGVWDAYSTGRGRITVRGRATIEGEDGGPQAIIIDEIPYQVNKARLIEQIADLVKQKRLDDIRALRDESDRHGMRIVVELKRNTFPEVVLNHLYKHTALQTTFGVILLAIVDQRPRILTLKEMLEHFIRHRRHVILRRTRHDLAAARARAHLLEGFLKALDLIDEIIALIRASRTVAEAKVGLIERFEFSDVQAQAILEMRLQRLTGMEREKILEQYQELISLISELEDILASEARLMGVVRTELLEVREAYADERRTQIVDNAGEVDIFDLVPEEDQVVTLSHLGYIKRCSPDEWRMQRRGGVGKKGMGTRHEDFVSSLFIAHTHSLLMVFTADGKVYPLFVHRLPEAGRGARGRSIANLVELHDDAAIAAVLPVRDFDLKTGREESEDEYNVRLLFVSRQGLVKATPLEAYRNLRQSGLIAAGVGDGDQLVVVHQVDCVDGTCHVMLLARSGMVIRFSIEDVPVSGRTARGNRGIRLDDDDRIVDALLVPAEDVTDDDDDFEDEDTDLVDDEDTGLLEDEDLLDDDLDESPTTTLLTVTELGYGKRTPFARYRSQKRYGKGLIGHKITGDTGGLVGGLQVTPDDQVMLVTDTGRVIRILAGDVRLTKTRSSRGVRLMRLEAGERIVDIARLEDPEEDEE